MKWFLIKNKIIMEIKKINNNFINFINYDPPFKMNDIALKYFQYWTNGPWRVLNNILIILKLGSKIFSGLSQYFL